MKNNHESVALHEAAQTRFGYAVAARLSLGSEQLPPGTMAALDQARMRALARQQRRAGARVWLGGAATAVIAGGPGDRASWRARLAAALALPALWFGLYALQHYQQERFVHRIADIDTALLLDDLPPQAYTDPGFRHYLRQGE